MLLNKIRSIIGLIMIVSLITLPASVFGGKKRILRVTATAYTSHASQTDRSPGIAAWGDRLRPGMKAIAVSNDLLYKYGMKRGTRVKISGLKGTYRVLDRMHKRWRKKIDIYMGKNIRAARKWGRRKVTITW